MSILNSVLKVFVGDKSKQDVKATMPLVNKIKSHEEELAALSHDELRQKTQEFKTLIDQARKDTEDRMVRLNEEAETTAAIDRKEEIYQEIDSLKDESYRITEEVL
ncbi:MAG: hypothetical protein KJO25_06770, partial [Bacteroidia bacterium]|nr:hypothetical protein [Bacteroidia bacterium]